MNDADDRFYDVIVVGVGAHGSAAMYQVAKRGRSVLGLEKFFPAHDRGSSHGLSRIIRLVYHEDPSYVPLLRRAYELWEDLEHVTGSDILHITGGLDIVQPGGAHEQMYWDSRQTAELHKIEHEVLEPEEIHQRFPGYRLPSDYKAVYQKQSGIVAPERAILAHVKAALQFGADLKEQEAMQSWWPDGAGVVVKTAKGVYRARKLVLTAGAWLPDIVPQLQAVIKVERQVIAWFDLLEPDRFKDNFPISIINDERGSYYIFPPFDHPGLKIGLFHHLKEVTKADDLDRNITARDEQVLREAVARYFPYANGKMSRAAACMFANATDSHFIIDKMPNHPQVIICQACSGHGYKFASVIGEILAEMAIDGATRHDISMHKIDSKRKGFKSLVDGFSASKI